MLPVFLRAKSAEGSSSTEGEKEENALPRVFRAPLPRITLTKNLSRVGGGRGGGGSFWKIQK